MDSTVPIPVELLGSGDLEWTDDSEPEELGVSVVPDALGKLRVLDFPDLVRSSLGCAS